MAEICTLGNGGRTCPKNGTCCCSIRNLWIAGDLPLNFHPAAVRVSTVFCYAVWRGLSNRRKREASVERRVGAGCRENLGKGRRGPVVQRGMRRSNRPITACRCATASRLATGPTIVLTEAREGLKLPASGPRAASSALRSRLPEPSGAWRQTRPSRHTSPSSYTALPR